MKLRTTRLMHSFYASFFIANFLGACCFAFAAETQANEGKPKPVKVLPLPGEKFEVDGCQAFLISPAKFASGKPWVWYAPTLLPYPGKEEKWMFEQFTNAGMAIAGIDVGESYGSPKGTAQFTALYDEMVKRGFSNRPCLLARSRGGLQLYNWAVEHPKSVSAIAGIYPVCDLRSYPNLKIASSAYGMTEEELEAKLDRYDPIKRIKPLADAGVPIFHIHGDADKLVPLDKNSGPMADEYRRFGGKFELVVAEGQGHNMWSGFFQCQQLVDFVIGHKGE